MNYQPILANFGITQLNQMQEASIKAISSGSDVMLISPTGSGKTLAFLLPILANLQPDKNYVQVLIIVPSRELAIQIEKVFKQMGTAFKVNCFYGGHSVRTEENSLTEPPAVLIGTPGRLGHHLRTKSLDLRKVHTLILDEFDKSLEFGFKEDMDFIIGMCKVLKQRVLTSATALDDVPSFVGYDKGVTLNYTQEDKELESALVSKFMRVQGDDKLEALMLLLGKIGSKPTIVFCNHREAVNRISEQLAVHKIAHGFYHGGLEQIDREKTLIKLRNGSVHFLITTDLAARGLDIPEIEYVVHYQLPATEDVLIHRNGRTARMNAAGTAYYLLDLEDTLPRFISDTPTEEPLPKEFVMPEPMAWKTLYIAAGKKDKINKMDIVGMLLQKGNLKKDELGKIEVLDKSAYVAIKANKIQKTLQLVQTEKIKGRKIKMEIAS
ncbi:MAG: helicase [Bacteroidetes bacterium B1(2017)]|nr:MAG: helicase [Bacteroidetes bacterium B1(2017)]